MSFEPLASVQGGITGESSPPMLSPSEVSSSEANSRLGSKRLSLNLPAQGINFRHHRHSATISVSPVRALSNSPDALSPEDPNSFLTALAAQERRVLELKEELKKAELDLSNLKSQWAAHEATKKRNQIMHRAEPLRPITSPKRSQFDPYFAEESEGSETNRSRRASYMRPKPQRKVFSGGHTRALSLLSPTGMANQGSARQTAPVNSAAPRIHHNTTSSTKEEARKLSDETSGSTQGAREDIMNTGKQLVGDIKDGLWTFIEDIRQATVGDEAVSRVRGSRTFSTPKRTSAPPRKKSPLPSTAPQVENRPPSALNYIDALPETIHLTQTGEQSSSLASPKEASLEDEGWDNWDSPLPKTSSTMSHSTTAASSPRTSLSSDATKDKRSSGISEQLPWPTLTKLTPSNLTRTASALMTEWERSLTPPAIEEQDQIPGY